MSEPKWTEYLVVTLTADEQDDSMKQFNDARQLVEARYPNFESIDWLQDYTLGDGTIAFRFEVIR